MTALLLVGLALSAEPALQDTQSLPRYLAPSQVQPVIEAALPALAACRPTAPDAPLALNVVIEIAPSGQVITARVEDRAAEPGDVACERALLCELAFPSQDEPQDRWTFAVAGRGEQIYLLPGLARVSRPRLPLFLYLPEPSEPASTWLSERLGADVYPAPVLEPLPACDPTSPPAPAEAPAAPTAP